MKNRIKRILFITPYRIHKSTTPNRFHAMEEGLSMIAKSHSTLGGVVGVGKNQ